jgi:hypothetical protein
VGVLKRLCKPDNLFEQAKKSRKGKDPFNFLALQQDNVPNPDAHA